MAFWRMPCFITLMLSSLLAGTGCARLMNIRSADRREHGYTLVMNGIESAHLCHAAFVAGLKSGGVESEIEIFDWTTGTVAMMLFHLRAESRNRRVAEQIVSKIVAYQDEYPGRPVSLVGHSGGGGMIPLVLEALPADRSIDCAIMLAAAISPFYDLLPALSKVDRGIWNYSSLVGDSPLLIAGTTVFGTIDGRHWPSAGATGFTKPWGMTTTERQLYDHRLIECPYELRMVLHGNLGDHYGPMNPLFARNELAPILSNAVRSTNTLSVR